LSGHFLRGFLRQDEKDVFFAVWWGRNSSGAGDTPGADMLIMVIIYTGIDYFSFVA
jgi:hypothetical protein